MSVLTFTRVVIIESLDPNDPNDFKSGTHLEEYIKGLADDVEYLPPVELIKVPGLGEFLDALRELGRASRENGERPILHIETHGLLDKSGLSFADGSDISWDDLKPHLIELNEATEFNLLLIVAACFGAHFLGKIKATEPSPCWALIGPSDTCYGSELLGAFREFYRPLLKSQDVNASLKGLFRQDLINGGFLVELAEEWFERSVLGYLRSGCTVEKIKERAAAHYARLPVKLPLEQIEALGWKRAREFVKDYFGIFFMTQRIEGNDVRFADVFTSASQNVESFLISQGH